MRNTFLTFICASILQIGYSQNCNCGEALSADLKDRFSGYNSSKTNEFFQNFFLSNETEREELIKNTSDKTGISVLIKNIPVGFESSNQNSKSSNVYKSIQREVRNTGVFTDENLESILNEHLSANQLAAYKACLESCTSLSSSGVFITTGGDEKNDFFVRIYFISKTGQEKITLAEDMQYTGCNTINELTLKKGTVIKNGQSITQFLKRKDITKPAMINFQFTEGIKVDPITLNAKENEPFIVPIGSIIASPLQPSEFLKQSGSENIFDYSKNHWAPCDGRPVKGSKYASQFNQTAPDLRAQFLRGYNTMLSDGQPSTITNGKNPDEEKNKKTNGYSYQEEDFKSHKHELKLEEVSVEKGVGDYNRDVFRKSDDKSINTASEGGKETRPNNMAVYYYIRIN